MSDRRDREDSLSEEVLITLITAIIERNNILKEENDKLKEKLNREENNEDGKDEEK